MLLTGMSTLLSAILRPCLVCLGRCKLSYNLVKFSLKPQEVVDLASLSQEVRCRLDYLVLACFF